MPPQVDYEYKTLSVKEELPSPCGSLEEVAVKLHSYITTYSEFEGVNFEYVTYDWEPWNEYGEPNLHYEVRYKRLETEEEYSNRIKAQKAVVSAWYGEYFDKETLTLVATKRKSELLKELEDVEKELNNLKELK